MRRLPAILLFVSLLLLVGCGSSDDGSDRNGSAAGSERQIFDVAPPQECTLTTRKKFVYDVFHDSYLWADTTPVVAYEDDQRYPDEEALIEALRDPKDRFSFTMSQRDYDNFFEAGKTVGYGIYFQVERSENNETAFDILLVYPGSPADRAGLRRSDRITGLRDGNQSYTIDAMLQDDTLFARYFEGEERVTAHFLVRDRNGTQRTVAVTRAEYDVKSVIDTAVLESDAGHRVGYLLFQSFVGTSEAELTQSFDYFKRAGIDDLVLDLRYNGGGYIAIADQLASLIGGVRAYGKIFNSVVYNEKYSRYNSRMPFYLPQNYLSLPRVYILTTPNSCSASELVINSLRARSVPVDVVQIGEHTCGKPYGMYPLHYCARYLLAVQMKNANADGEGDYVDGLMPTCSAADDREHLFGDPHEGMLATALYHIQNGACPPATRSVRAAGKRLHRVAPYSFRERYGLY